MSDDITVADAIFSVLTTPDDEKNVPETVREVAQAVTMVAKQLEVQNKILVKILSAVTPSPGSA